MSPSDPESAELSRTAENFQPLAAYGHFGANVFRAALDVLQGYLLVADAERRVKYLSKAPIGSKIPQFIGKDFLELIADDERPLVREALARVLRGGSAVTLEARGRESGRWYRMSVASVVEHGTVIGFSVHAIDVDDEKRRETETAFLRARLPSGATSAGSIPAASSDIQRRFDLMADALPMLISYVDADRRYQYNNAAYERWFECSREDLRGVKVDEILGRAAYEQVKSYVDTVLGGRAVTFELSVPYRKAGPRQVIAHYVPDIGPSGEILGYYALIEDVTAARQAEQALRQREDELRQLQKMEALGRLAGGMAHEFNNLLQVVIASCSAVLPLLQESPAAAQIARIRRAAERGASLTRQLLSFSRSADPGPTATLDVDDLISDIQVMFERLLGAQIRIETALHAHVPIRADAGQIQQILMNLSINARDAMPNGGTLRISTARMTVARDDAAAYPALTPGDYLLLTVADTGTGMDASTLARVFDPFFTTKPPERGTGLGLSTVYGILQRIGGYIDVESELGHGATFRLYFPIVGSPSSADPCAAE